MNKILTILIAVFALSCHRKTVPQKETVVKDSIVYKEKIVRKDSTIFKKDTVRLNVPVDCPDVKVSDSTKSNKIKLKVHLKNNKITAECNADSLLERITELEKTVELEKYNKEKEIVEIEVDKPVPYIPKWMWWMLCISLLIIIIFLKNPILAFLKHLKKP